MSFPESDISDLLEKADAEELYKNVHEIVNYVDDSLLSHSLHDDLSGSFRTLEAEQSMDLKQELFNEYSLEANSSLLPQQNIPQQIPPVLSPPISVCNEEYVGPHNFDVSIIPNGSKNPWVFSSMLNKVYIDMGSHFPVDFRVTSRPLNENLYIRVLPSFSSLQYSQELVYRCVQHEQPQLNKNIPEHVRQHIIRCPSNGNAHYLGDRNSNQRLSILFPFSFPQTGTDAVREMFVFVCKSSCPTGMNRKPIEIIFTLETYDGQILGRRILNVRICSCPKRDKEKEEKDSMNKDAAPQGKKRKLEKTEKKMQPTCDKNIHTVTVEIPGKQNVQRVLTYCHDLIAGEMARNPQNNDAAVMACFKKIQAQLNET